MNNHGYRAYVGLDIYEEAIVVAIARGCGESAQRSENRNEPEMLQQLAQRLNSGGDVLSFCYRFPR